MVYYQIWVNLAPGVKDLEFCDAVDAYLGYFESKNLMVGHRICRRMLGLGPSELGEFYLELAYESLTQLDEMHRIVKDRTAEVEALHVAVYSRVTHYRSGLTRAFPDR